ncbi:MAG: response regulator [Candidatus Korobacteraceae bacterium]
MAEHILIVDDDSVSGRVLAQVLGLSGYEALVAEDGFDALLKIVEHQPDLLISDLRMPRMSGFELLSVVRRRFPEIPVISISGDYDPLVLPPCVICDAFFQKGGYELPDLLARVSELLRGTHRAALQKGSAVPVWLPRGHDDYYIVTCTNCLRSFPTRGSTEEEHALQQTPCMHCETALTYYIEGRKI